MIFLYKEVIGKPLERVQALRAKRPAHVRTAPSRQQVASLLEYVEDMHDYPTRLITQLLYGCGLRVSEPLNLRIKDVDLENSRLTIRDAKGGKSRVVPLPCSLIAPIQEQMQRARLLWEADQLKRVPVPLPGRLGIKYPKAAGSWAWYWLFPAHRPCKHPRSGEVVRWRVHESNVQRAVRWAARKCDLEGVVTPHVLRHAYATHVMQQGCLRAGRAGDSRAQFAGNHHAVPAHRSRAGAEPAGVTEPVLESAPISSAAEIRGVHRRNAARPAEWIHEYR